MLVWISIWDEMYEWNNIAIFAPFSIYLEYGNQDEMCSAKIG